MLDNIGAAGQKTRKIYQRRLPEDPSQDYYYIIRQTKPLQSLLVEYGFIDNKADQQKLQNNLLDYVEAVVKAIAEYAGVPYKAPTDNPPSKTEYVVQKGDTLYSIAKKLNTTVDELKKVNNLSDNTISIGQILLIPGANNEPDNPEYQNYTVKKGDSLYKIAALYETSIEELKRINNLTSDALYIGQVLKVPAREQVPTPPITRTYTVEKGDSLYSIAQKFNTTVEELRRLNDLTSDVLSIGQVLIIPEGNNPQDYIIYTVQRGDTLYQIATKFNTDIDAIKFLNNLKSDTLSIGQQILIPTTVPTETYIIYTVEKGDSLYSIAKKYNISVEELKTANNLTNNLLNIGQTLKIPTTKIQNI